MLKNKKMLHLLFLNQTQLTNEVLFSYSYGITELMSFISFKTFVPEILPLTLMGIMRVDTPVVVLLILKRYHMFILHYGVSSHIRHHFELRSQDYSKTY